MLEIFSESAISHLLLHKPHQIKRLWVFEKHQTHQRIKDLLTKAENKKIPIELRKTTTENHIGALINDFQFDTLERILESKPKMLLACDHLQDPQNFGALCRTAEALGVGGVIIPKDRSVQITPGVYAASAGAIETVPIIQVVNIRNAFKRLKEENFWIIGADMRGEDFSKIPKYDHIVLVLGSEYEGLSEHVKKDCDVLIRVPIKGKIESLNVSVTGAILMNSLL